MTTLSVRFRGTTEVSIDIYNPDLTVANTAGATAAADIHQLDSANWRPDQFVVSFDSTRAAGILMSMRGTRARILR